MTTLLISLWCLLSPAALLPAHTFARNHDGKVLSPRPEMAALFVINCIIFLTPGNLMSHLTLSSFFTFMAQLAWLDRSNHWLPQCFTTTFIVAGGLLSGSVSHLLAALMLWLLFYALERCPAGPGRGDKWLCAGLGMWLGLHIALLITGAALGLILSYSKFFTRHTSGQPLAPWVFIASLPLLFH